MDPLVIGGLLSAGSSLLGGLFGSSKQSKTDAANLAAVRDTNASNERSIAATNAANAANVAATNAANAAIARETNEFNRAQIAEQNAYNDPAAIRERAEKSGFNPLLFVGPGVGSQTSVAQGAMPNFETAMSQAFQAQPGLIQGSNYMGSAIADAGLLLADGIANNRERTQVQRLQEQNKDLQDRLNQATLRPVVGGVYAQRERMPSMREALGARGETAQTVDQVVSDNSPLAVDPLGPDSGDRTPVQLATARDVPAFRMFGHDFYGTGAFSTGEQVEDALGEGPMQWPFAVANFIDAVANETYKAGGKLRYRVDRARGRYGFTSDGARYMMQPQRPRNAPRVAPPAPSIKAWSDRINFSFFRDGPYLGGLR